MALRQTHYGDVTMGAIASQITSLTIVYSTVYSDADQSKHQSSASLAFVWGIHRGPVNSPHKGPVTRKMFLFDDVIMLATNIIWAKDGQVYWGIYVLLGLNELKHLRGYFSWLHSFLLGQDPRHITDHIFKCISVTENVNALIQIYILFIPKGPVDKTNYFEISTNFKQGHVAFIQEKNATTTLTHSPLVEPHGSKEHRQ